MKKNKLIIKDNIIIIYILLILFTYIFSINKIEENIESKDILKEKNHLFVSFQNFEFKTSKKNEKNNSDDIWPPFGPDDDYDEEEQRRQQRDNLTNEIQHYDIEIKRLNTEISKRKIYIIFLSILASILFLMIVIYSSIKCFILCTKKNVSEYRVSDISVNRLGEVYIDENGEERKKKMSIKNLDDCADAPIYANNKGKNTQINTFNPDNYIYSSQDKRLYKPYNNQDIQ